MTPPPLGPAELAARLEIILESAERLLRRIPDDRMDWVPPERDRTVRDLGYHVFRASLAFIDAMDAGRFAEGWEEETAPAEMRASRALADYGALVCGRVGGWFEGTSAGEYARIIDAADGPRSGHELLARTTRHAAQQLRQLHAMAERIGIAPPVPLPVDTFRGLSLPDAPC